MKPLPWEYKGEKFNWNTTEKQRILEVFSDTGVRLSDVFSCAKQMGIPESEFPNIEIEFEKTPNYGYENNYEETSEVFVNYYGPVHESVILKEFEKFKKCVDKQIVAEEKKKEQKKAANAKRAEIRKKQREILNKLSPEDRKALKDLEVDY